MQLVVAVIRPFKLEATKIALQLVGVTGMSVSEVQGAGRQGGHTEVFRGAEYQLDFQPKIRIEIVTEANLVEEIIDAICQSALTGKIGDGKIWVIDLATVVRVRTGERGREAI